MRTLTAVVGFALLWVAVGGELATGAFLLGLAAGGLVVAVLGVRADRLPPLSRVGPWLAFIALYLWEVVRSNLRLATLILSSTDRMRAAVIAVPIEGESDLELVVLSNFVTFTPGSMALDVSDDRGVLYLHVIGHEAPERLREPLARLADRIARLTR